MGIRVLGCLNGTFAWAVSPSPVTTSNLCAIGNVLFVQYVYLHPAKYHETNDMYEVDQEFVKYYEKLKMETKVTQLLSSGPYVILV